MLVGSRFFLIAGSYLAALHNIQVVSAILLCMFLALLHPLWAYKSSPADASASSSIPVFGCIWWLIESRAPMWGVVQQAERAHHHVHVLTHRARPASGRHRGSSLISHLHRSAALRE